MNDKEFACFLSGRCPEKGGLSLERGPEMLHLLLFPLEGGEPGYDLLGDNGVVGDLFQQITRGKEI